VGAMVYSTCLCLVDEGVMVEFLGGVSHSHYFAGALEVDHAVPLEGVGLPGTILVGLFAALLALVEAVMMVVWQGYSVSTLLPEYGTSPACYMALECQDWLPPQGALMTWGICSCSEDCLQGSCNVLCFLAPCWVNVASRGSLLKLLLQKVQVNQRQISSLLHLQPL